MRSTTLIQIFNAQKSLLANGAKIGPTWNLLLKCDLSTKTQLQENVTPLPEDISQLLSKNNLKGIRNIDRQSASLYPVRTVQIQTCGELYEKWRPISRLHRNAPAGGVEWTVEYADTFPNWDPTSKVPVVLALHGSPGDHNDFAEMIVSLWTETNARVIAPNFPTFDITRRTVFRHTAEEKAEYLKDFLRQVNVPRIDAVIAHSSSLFPSLLAYEGSDGPEIKSFVFLSPAGHRLIKSMKPKYTRKFLKSLSLNPVTRKFFESRMGKEIFKALRFPIEVEKMDRFWLPIITMDNSGYENVERQLKLIRRDKLPILYAFGERDKLVDKEIFHEMTQLSGARREDFDIYGPDGKVIHASNSTESPNGLPPVRVLVFQSGGHYACFKYSNIVNSAVLEHLRGLKPSLQ